MLKLKKHSNTAAFFISEATDNQENNYFICYLVRLRSLGEVCPAL